MAFQMNYTNLKQSNYPESYWRLGWYQLDRTSNNGRIRFDCYFNFSARENNVENNVLESKNYLITGDDFVVVFETSEDMHEAMYEYAKNCKEGAPPPEGEEDTRVSFFETATDV